MYSLCCCEYMIEPCNNRSRFVASTFNAHFTGWVGEDFFICFVCADEMRCTEYEFCKHQASIHHLLSRHGPTSLFMWRNLYSYMPYPFHALPVCVSVRVFRVHPFWRCRTTVYFWRKTQPLVLFFCNMVLSWAREGGSGRCHVFESSAFSLFVGGRNLSFFSFPLPILIPTGSLLLLVTLWFVHHRV